jgi:hypothetical protein
LCSAYFQLQFGKIGNACVLVSLLVSVGLVYMMTN